MNANDPQRLEAAIQRELQSLPELAAPAALAGRVMDAIARRSARPWYRQPWPAWPIAVRAASLVIGLAFLGALCFAGWRCSHSPAVAVAARELEVQLSGFSTAGRTIGVLLNAALQVVKSLGTPFVVAGLAAAALLYGSCVGLGTMLVRMATVRR